MDVLLLFLPPDGKKKMCFNVHTLALIRFSGLIP